MVASTCAAFDELVELGTAERSQTSDVGHVGVERTQGHAHLSEFDVNATLGQVVRRRDQLAVIGDLWTKRDVGGDLGTITIKKIQVEYCILH